ncbi:MAG: energy transducer TonB [Chryseobacterium sp.]|jgi:protein TonB|uniref:energy transducer TonB n=1 Tax=Chryseobacterium sp. TaxID=1871047 RepID=UPI00262A242F|nr:energy transducer TonB [Chryseobacterium sp.]MDF2553503.1 energy transducer TonB [Chryseobacterium sp.]
MKHLQTNQDFRFNEVLFEGRNKQYGAYVLRNESDRILTKALFVGVSLLAAVSLTPMLISAFKTVEKVVPNEPIYRPVDILPNDDIAKPKPVETVKPVQPVAPPNTKQFDSTVPTPTKEAVEPAKIDKPDDAVAGLVDNVKGIPAPVNTYVPPIPTVGTGTTKVKDPVTIPQGSDNSIKGADELSVSANFEGGIESFRTKVTNKFDGSGFASDDVMKTTVTFIVEKDGTISGIKADGKDTEFNAEAMRTIKSIKGKWIPGKNKKGEAVRSYFKFPISMKFDN